MKLIGKTIFALLSLTMQSSHAGDIPHKDMDFACLPEAEANRYISDFGIDVQSFGGKELCDPIVDTKKLLNDISIVKMGEFRSSGENNLIKGFVNAAQYYDWMKSQTYGVERGNDVPYATAYNSGGYFTMQDGWAKLSTLGRVGTFIHEARHTEGYRHMPCSHGPYQGVYVAACDPDYNYGGSHAVEMEYYARVAVQGNNFHPVYKKMARLMAVARSNFVFNTSPMQTREGLLALSIDRKQAYLYDRGEWTIREVPKAEGALKRTSFGAVIFDGLNAFSVEMYENSGFQDQLSDSYSYYKLLSTKVKNFEEFDQGVKRYAVQITSDNKLSSYNFPQGSWGSEQQVPFTAIKTSTALPGLTKSGLFLIKDSGETYEYDPNTKKIEKVDGIWDFNNYRTVNSSGQSFVLKNDGKIYNQTGQVLQTLAGQPELASDLVSVPLYDAFRVVKQ